jgi:chromosome segregation ATPase
MVEPIMYLAIGFLISMLCGLMIVPLVHNRAVRLTTKRLEAATPLSMAEIQADKDQLRAEFAMSARRLEMSVDQLKNKTTSQLAELGKKSDAINRLKIELSEKNAAIFALEAREKAAKDQLRNTEADFAAKTKTLRAAEQALLDKQRELEKLTGRHAERAMVAEGHQSELATVNAEVQALQRRVNDAETDFGASQQKLTEQRNDSDAAARALEDARNHTANLAERTGELEQQLLARVKETETLGSRVAELENRLTEQDRLLADRERENSLLRQQIEAARKAEQPARQETAVGGAPSASAPDKSPAEKAAIEDQLRTANDDRARLQRELNTLQQQTESSWATERMENALLRERINDIAAEVAKLASTIEGPNSPIEAILAAEPSAAKTGPANGSAPNDAAGTSGGTLADRIRALQSHASRARQTG